MRAASRRDPLALRPSSPTIQRLHLLVKFAPWIEMWRAAVWSIFLPGRFRRGKSLQEQSCVALSAQAMPLPGEFPRRSQNQKIKMKNHAPPPDSAAKVRIARRAPDACTADPGRFHRRRRPAAIFASPQCLDESGQTGPRKCRPLPPALNGRNGNTPAYVRHSIANDTRTREVGFLHHPSDQRKISAAKVGSSLEL